MGSWRKAYGRFGAIALALVVVAGCTGATATLPPLRPSGPVAVASGIHVELPSSGPKSSEAAASAAPRATAGAVTVDQITADYTYKSDLITPLAHLYGSFLDDFVIVTLQNANPAPVKVIVSSEISGFTDKATDTVTVDASSTKEIRQNPRLTIAAIDGLNSEHPGTLHVVVSYQGGTILDQTSETLITSRDDFPWGIKGFTQQENYNLVVAMMTPTDPSLAKLIRAAANYDPNSSMISGYHSDLDYNGDVWQRLSDIWQAETTDFKLTYISTPITFASGSSQRIRLPGEVLDQSSGNCIELTLLYASVVEALGMQAALVIVPGHAYVAVRLDGTSDSFYFIETTMIGQATFDQALTEGLKEWQTAQTHVNAAETDYGWVSVAAARKDGVIPIPWR